MNLQKTAFPHIWRSAEEIERRDFFEISKKLGVVHSIAQVVHLVVNFERLWKGQGSVKFFYRDQIPLEKGSYHDIWMKFGALASTSQSLTWKFPKTLEKRCNRGYTWT